MPLHKTMRDGLTLRLGQLASPLTLRPLMFLVAFGLLGASYFLHAEVYGSGAQEAFHALLPSSEPPIVSDLLDTDLYIPSHGESLINAEKSMFGPYTMTLPDDIHAGTDFNIEIHCDPSIIGTPLCPPMYQVHFHGPIAYSVPANQVLYRYDKSGGTVTVTTSISQPGKYETWAWPQWTGATECPWNSAEYMESGNMTVAVQGSGKTVLDVQTGLDGEVVDNFRECNEVDYLSEMNGRWISLNHVAEKHGTRPWVKKQVKRMSQLYPYGAVPDYIYAPYQCKHRVDDYPNAFAAIPDLSHVAFVGDSHTRMRFCSHIFPAMHDGEDTGTCRVPYPTTDAFKHADRAFVHTTDSGRQIHFSQRFIARPLKDWWSKVDSLRQADPPISHIILNSGSWWGRFGEKGRNEYRDAIIALLERVVKALGRQVKIMWITTPSVTPAALICDSDLKRYVLKHHGDYAREAIHDFRDRYPDVQVLFIDAFHLYDNRPETTQEGRHWVQEGIRPSLSVRPHVGRADHAVMELVLDAWRVSTKPRH